MPEPNEDKPNLTKNHEQNSQVMVITQADLPLSCPPSNQALWNLHPRVYLPIEKTGKAVCPYCGINFELNEHLG